MKIIVNEDEHFCQCRWTLFIYCQWRWRFLSVKINIIQVTRSGHSALVYDLACLTVFHVLCWQIATVCDLLILSDGVLCQQITAVCDLPSLSDQVLCQQVAICVTFSVCLTMFYVLCQQIAAVCDFYTYIRYIAQGLVKSAGKDQTVVFKRWVAQ